MQELIKIENKVIGAETVNSVNARELCETLEIKKEFSTWMKSQITSLGLEENVDYIIFKTKVKAGRGTTIKTEYIITTDTAKHISMASRTPKGKEVRNYFIEVEKTLHVENPEIKKLQQTILEQNKLIASKPVQSADERLLSENKQLKRVLLGVQNRYDELFENINSRTLAKELTTLTNQFQTLNNIDGDGKNLNSDTVSKHKYWMV